MKFSNTISVYLAAMASSVPSTIAVVVQTCDDTIYRNFKDGKCESWTWDSMWALFQFVFWLFVPLIYRVVIIVLILTPQTEFIYQSDAKCELQLWSDDGCTGKTYQTFTQNECHQTDWQPRSLMCYT